MKTKAEIKEKISGLRHNRDIVKKLPNSEPYVFAQNGSIRALEWVLGYKRKRMFWCTGCRLAHQGLKCPKCKNARPTEGIKGENDD